MADLNIILGYGETLTRKETLTHGGSPKSYPYSIEEQREWLSPQFESLLAAEKYLSPLTKPRGESVAKITLHPTFLAKSYHPSAALAAAGLRCIGSKSTIITPRKVTTKKKGPEPTLTAELFVAGKAEGFRELYSNLLSPSLSVASQQVLCRFELIASVAAKDKLFINEPLKMNSLVEVALHASKTDVDILASFNEYIVSLGGEADTKRAIVVSGLTFLPVLIPEEKIEAVAAFMFVRVVRSMPTLRIGGQDMRTVPNLALPELPSKSALDPKLLVAVFDGGIGHTGIEQWVTETIMPGTQSTSPAYLNHGNGVTSSILFGPLDKNAITLSAPYANVEHYRVISPTMGCSDGIVDIDLYDVLNNINTALSSKKFDFLNLSLGPNMPVQDDEVHPWTALIDQYLADGKTLATVAVGNDGHKPWPECRIQPPSDMVNAIAVGACDSQSEDWKRASYSSYGPGRSPGLIKPDGLSFGGSDDEQFTLYNPLTSSISETMGTSFGSPALLRIGIGIKASLSFDLEMLAVRALLCHHANRKKNMAMSEVGHGRFPQTIDEVLTCDDNEVRVIYQGVLSAGQNLRALIPFPTLPARGKITLRATLSFASQTDPEHAINYTRAGLSVTFRPKGRFKKTAAFFSAGKLYTPEFKARLNEQKWETTLKHEQTFNIGTLDDPLFDITYGAREEGQSVDNENLPALPYAMVITLSVEDTPGIYNNIRQRYQTLQPVRLRSEIQLQQKLGGN